MKDFTTIKTILFSVNDRKYRISVKQTNSKSNYNIFVAVYEVGNRTALVGTTFKNTYTDNEVRLWSLKAINEYNKQSNTLFS